ncbi:MAG TPA: DUF2066 domain-containing protein, partial [Gammaproteobacteria bacterium]|nr:DUF2066 domain-containing protein [Gammaproteobacteria bacterium]
MVKLVCIIIIVGASMLSPCSANATTLAHLYEVSVPVFTQSAEERKQAIHQAFAELLVRVTGKRDVLSLKSGQTLLKKSRRYVRSFRYEILPPPMVFEKDEPSDAEAPVLPAAEINEPVPVAPAPEPGQKIVVFFDEIAVKNSLWKQALPVWGKTRPSTLLWVAIQDGDGRKMLDIAKPTAISEKIKLESEKRGVPFVYPKLDLRDQAEINISDVWGTYEEPVKNASARYKTEAVISARFSFDPAQGWETYWRLHQGIEETHWRVTEADLNVVIAESIDKLASVLADRYAQISIASGADRFIIR